MPDPIIVIVILEVATEITYINCDWKPGQL